MSKVQCDKCKKLYLNEITLKNHIKKCLTKDVTNNDESNFCIYCNKSYKSIYYLNSHTIKCKELHEIQDIKILEQKYICLYCNKNYSSTYALNNHKVNCNKKMDIDIQELLNKINVLENEKIALETSRNQFRDQYNALLEKCTQAKNINNTVVYNNNSTNTNNNITLKQVVSTLEPISHDDIKDSMVHFTNKYIDDGVKGFAKFMVDFVCNNKIVTSDHSRNTIAYRTTYENFIRDPECINIINSTLKQNSNYLINVLDERKEHYRKLMDENSDNFDTYLIKASKIHELKRITEASKSENADVNIKDISNILCNHGAKTYNKCVELISKQK